MLKYRQLLERHTNQSLKLKHYPDALLNLVNKLYIFVWSACTSFPIEMFTKFVLDLLCFVAKCWPTNYTSFCLTSCRAFSWCNHLKDRHSEDSDVRYFHGQQLVISRHFAGPFKTKPKWFFAKTHVLKIALGFGVFDKDVLWLYVHQKNVNTLFLNQLESQHRCQGQHWCQYQSKHQKQYPWRHLLQFIHWWRSCSRKIQSLLVIHRFRSP